jgi:hypothetical protein
VSRLSSRSALDTRPLLRRLVEGCDWLRNVTVLADLYDGFGGVACTLCEEIRDELPRITMVCVSLLSLPDLTLADLGLH